MLVAVIVPNQETIKRWAKELGFTKPFEELCSLSELQEHIISELKSTAEKNKVCLNWFDLIYIKFLQLKLLTETNRGFEKNIYI